MAPNEQPSPTDHQIIQETYQLTVLNNQYLQKIHRNIQIQTIIKGAQIGLFVILLITSYVALSPLLKKALNTYQSFISPPPVSASQSVTERLTPQSIQFLKSIEQNLRGV